MLMISPPRALQGGGGGLRQEQRRLEVGAHQVVPVDLGDIAHRGGEEGRGVVDEHVEAAEGLDRARHQARQLRHLEQVALGAQRRTRPCLVQLALQGRGVLGGAAVVQHQVRAAGVHEARDLGAHALGGAGDQDGLAGKQCGFAGGRGRRSWEPIMTASAPRSMLPPLSAEERRHSEALAELIRAQVRAAGGWLSFERFMALALYAPGLGYYSAGARKLGPGGDFVTAPQMSGLFSRCLARTCAEVLGRTGGQILELGAGTGVHGRRRCSPSWRPPGCCRSATRSWKSVPTWPRASASTWASCPRELRERVVWLERLPAAPARRRDPRQRGGRCAAVPALPLPGRRACASSVSASAAPGSSRRRAARPDPALARAWAAVSHALPAPLPHGYASESVPDRRAVDREPRALPRARRAAAVRLRAHAAPLLPPAARERHAALPLPAARAR